MSYPIIKRIPGSAVCCLILQHKEPMDRDAQPPSKYHIIKVKDSSAESALADRAQGFDLTDPDAGGRVGLTCNRVKIGLIIARRATRPSTGAAILS